MSSTKSAAVRLAADLTLPLSVVTETIAILGIRGSGKTNTAVDLVEDLLEAGQQVVVIDPTDVWWGLKSSADGKAAGYPVTVLGGRYADLPLAAGDGRAIADFVVDHGASLVCALRHFESKADQRRFVTEFADRIYHRKGQAEHATALMLVFDEASLFVPQRVMGEDTRMVGAIQRLVRQGRSSGFGVTLIDQRAASVNKDVLTQLELLICHRTTSPQDRKALQAWVEQHDADGHAAEFLGSLASLPQGTAWLWSPGWLNLFVKAAMRMRRTYDSSRTPKPGELVVKPRTVAAVDLEQLRAQLAATVEQARADDPKTLRARIAELERELKTKPAGASQAELDAATERGRDAAIRYLGALLPRQASELRNVAGHLEDVAGVAVRAMRETAGLFAGDAVRGAVDNLATVEQEHTGDSRAEVQLGHTKKGTGANQTPGVGHGQQSASTRGPMAASRSPAPTALEAPAGARGGMQRILDALLWLEALGVQPASRIQVGALADLTLTAGAGSRYVTRLQADALLQVPAPGQLELTAAGRALADPVGAPRSRAELHARVLGRLDTDGERRILDYLLRHYPEAATRAEIGAAVGLTLTAGAGSRYASRLTTLSLATVPRPGALRASDLLFPRGLR